MKFCIKKKVEYSFKLVKSYILVMICIIASMSCKKDCNSNMGIYKINVFDEQPVDVYINDVFIISLVASSGSIEIEHEEGYNEVTFKSKFKNYNYKFLDTLKSCEINNIPKLTWDNNIPKLTWDYSIPYYTIPNSTE